VIPILIKRSLDGTALQLFAPDSLSDNLPVWSLAQVYAEVAEELLNGKAERIARPSGWVAAAKEFVEAVNAQLVVKHLDQSPCLVEIKPNGKPPMSYENPEAERLTLNLNECWEQYAKELRDTHYLLV
jgi:hypothetical protein